MIDLRTRREAFRNGILADVEAMLQAKLGAVAVPIHRRLVVVIDGGGQPITTGLKTSVPIHDDLDVVKWTLTADVSGSIVLDLKRATYANWPTTTSIVGASGPQLSGAQKASANVAFGAWTSLHDGDILDVVVSATATVQRVTLSLRCRAP
jgi:hypothetical protein